MLSKRITCLFFFLSFCFIIGCYQQESKKESVQIEEAKWYEEQTRLAAKNESRCVECHKEQFEEWKGSQHAHANRDIGTPLDDIAFSTTQKVEYGKRSVEFYKDGSDYVIKEQWEGKEAVEYRPVAVIGVEPLIQYLVPIEGGQLQAYDFAYDVDEYEWFNVFNDERRQEDEWGYWKNRGLNWNSQCAFCHMTDLKKNYNHETNSYHTTWENSGISCTQCHGNMDGHPENAVKYDTPSMDSCASCHSVREELDSEFKQENSFHDEFSITLVDSGNRYYADGQILDEDFEYGSFITTRMYHKGVDCFDCHNPHSGKLTLPATNNALCMQCHTSPGIKGAMPIDPLTHSNHKMGSTGNQCVECHMSHTTYMARDPRRDHGFIKPDPLLTKELGIPNSCNRCHDDKSVDWAIQWTEKWYPGLEGSDQRERARLVHKAKQAEVDMTQEILQWYEKEEVVAWKAIMIGLLKPWANQAEIIKFCNQLKDHKEPLIRQRAAQVLGLSARGQELLKDWSQDGVKAVRISAIQGWSRHDISSIRNNEEYYQYLANQMDQPTGLMKMAEFKYLSGETSKAIRYIGEAAILDKTSPQPILTKAELLSREGKIKEAKVVLQEGLNRFGNDYLMHFSLALIEAELGNLNQSAIHFQDSLKINPDFGDGWKNLALNYANLGNLDECLRSIERAMSIDAQNPDYRYVYAWALYQKKVHQKAREVLDQLLIDFPGHSSAMQLRNAIP